MKKVLATVLVLCSLFYSLQAKAASSLAHATPTVNVHLCQIFMKEYSRPLIDTVRISVPEAKQLGYLFDTKKDRVILNQYNGTAGLAICGLRRTVLRNKTDAMRSERTDLI